jgi:hypothetical protein
MWIGSKSVYEGTGVFEGPLGSQEVRERAGRFDRCVRLTVLSLAQQSFANSGLQGSLRCANGI